MSRRQEYRKRVQKQKSRNRLIVILSVAAVAILVALVLILPGLKKTDVSNIVQITPVTFNVPVNKTSLGDPNAPVKMDVWEDFQCSGCLAYTRDIEPDVIKDFVDTGKVYYTFHSYPFISSGQGESQDAANAAMCAAAQDHFWDFHAIAFANWIGENAGSFTKDRLQAFAQAIGLNMSDFNKCFAANTYAADIQKDIDAGAALGVPPTPGIFVNDKMVVSSAGPNYIPSVDDIASAINTAAGAN